MLLREKDKQALLQIFSDIKFPVEIWAYGSRVNGSAHDGSDLDLVLRSQHLTRLPLGIVDQLNEKIRDSNIPILIELRDWAMLPKSFHNNIERHYEVLFDNRKVAEEANQQSILYEPPAKYKAKSKENNPDK
jgi:uncharacterized protein